MHLPYEITKILGKEVNIFRKRETMDYIKNSTLTTIKEAPLNLILVANGILDTNTMKLLPFSPEHLFINAIPTAYNTKPNPEAMAIWDNYLNTTLDPQDILGLQEMSGYCLYRDYFIEKLFLLVGPGGNGKTVYMLAQNAMLGVKNVTHIAMQSLEESRFDTNDLFGKLANLADEVTADGLKSTAVIKQLTGGSAMSAEPKFKGLQLHQLRQANIRLQRSAAMPRRHRLVFPPLHTSRFQP